MLRKARKQQERQMLANGQLEVVPDEQTTLGNLKDKMIVAKKALNQLGKNPKPKDEVDDGLWNASMFEEGGKSEEDLSDKATNGDTQQQRRCAQELLDITKQVQQSNSKMLPPNANADGAGPSGIGKTDENAKSAASALHTAEAQRTARELSIASRQSPAAQPLPTAAHPPPTAAQQAHTTPPPNTPQPPQTIPSLPTMPTMPLQGAPPQPPPPAPPRHPPLPSRK